MNTCTAVYAEVRRLLSEEKFGKALALAKGSKILELEDRVVLCDYIASHGNFVPKLVHEYTRSNVEAMRLADEGRVLDTNHRLYSGRNTSIYHLSTFCILLVMCQYAVEEDQRYGDLCFDFLTVMWAMYHQDIDLGIRDDISSSMWGSLVNSTENLENISVLRHQDLPTFLYVNGGPVTLRLLFVYTLAYLTSREVSTRRYSCLKNMFLIYRRSETAALNDDRQYLYQDEDSFIPILSFVDRLYLRYGNEPIEREEVYEKIFERFGFSKDLQREVTQDFGVPFGR